MSVLAKLPLNATVSFNVHPSSLLGTGFQHAKVLAHLDVDTARQWIDPESMHINVYPFLPAGVPNDAAQYSYVKLKLANGTITVIGAPWIQEDTIVVSSQTTLTITVDQVGPEDREHIVKMLAANGYSAAKVVLQ